MAESFKPKLSGAEFVEKLQEAGFTEKTIDALREEDIVSDTSLKILSSRDIETLADDKKLTIGQKRLLVEFATSLKPKKESDRSDSRRGPPPNAKYSRTNSRSPLSDRRRHDGDRMNPEKSTCIGVFNLANSTKESTLSDIFSRFGYVKDVKLVYDKLTGESRGFGFIYFADLETAEYAKESCAGMAIEGKTIRTEFSITKRAHSPTPGAYLGRDRRGRSGGRPERNDSYGGANSYGMAGSFGGGFRGGYSGYAGNGYASHRGYY